jgi:hypothetical protein
MTDAFALGGVRTPVGRYGGSLRERILLARRPRHCFYGGPGTGHGDVPLDDERHAGL